MQDDLQKPGNGFCYYQTVNKKILAGEVKRFSGQGRKLGYPTANIEIPKTTPEGLFTGYTKLAGHNYPSIIFVGIPITMGETIKRAESWMLDFPDRDLYGEEIEITIVKKLRENQNFGSKEKLIAQMKKDEQIARKYFQAS